jgi:hypothetical protein
LSSSLGGGASGSTGATGIAATGASGAGGGGSGGGAEAQAIKLAQAKIGRERKLAIAPDMAMDLVRPVPAHKSTRAQGGSCGR